MSPPPHYANLQTHIFVNKTLEIHTRLSIFHFFDYGTGYRIDIQGNLEYRTGYGIDSKGNLEDGRGDGRRYRRPEGPGVQGEDQAKVLGEAGGWGP